MNATTTSTEAIPSNRLNKLAFTRARMTLAAAPFIWIWEVPPM